MQAWRREVIQRVWEALDHQDAESSTSHAFLLRFRCEHSDCTSEELAEQLRKTTGDTVSATTLRQKLLRARQQFCVHMRAEIRKTLGPTANDESVDEELAELGLLKYNVCKYPK